ncbi:MAG: type I restriction endonuclease [Syntrophomonas sp.]
MGFKEDIQKLSVQISERKEHVTNEEMAKQALIIPFLQVLGFDVFNPLEVRPEYDSDFGKKKGEKVDYAIFKDGNPIMFIEAKSVNENLDNHDTQLSRYFNATPDVKVGILTNGVNYKFFTDLNTNNIMDDIPFLNVCITELSDLEIETLDKFKKDCFETHDAVALAEELIYTSNLNHKLEDIFKNPPDEFIRYLIKDFSDTRITANVIDKFRPIVKKSISQALLNMVSQGLASQDTDVTETIPDETSAIAVTGEDAAPARRKAEIVTTNDELKAFELIKSVFSDNGKDASLLQYKDTTSYFSIYIKNPANWLVRLYLDNTKKNITTNLSIEKARELAPDYEVGEAVKGMGISRIYINNINDIPTLSDLLVACFNDVVRE